MKRRLSWATTAVLLAVLLLACTGAESARVSTNSRSRKAGAQQQQQAASTASRIQELQHSGVKDEVVDKALFAVNKVLENVGDALKPVDTYDKNAVETLISSGAGDLGFLQTGSALKLSRPPLFDAAPSTATSDSAPGATPSQAAAKSAAATNRDAVSLLESLANSRVNQKVLAGDGRAGVPPFEDLPSMAPHDGLDGDSFGPLANPKPFRGDKVPAGVSNSDVPPYLGKIVTPNSLKFIAGGGASLPPLVGPKSEPASLFGANILPTLVLPEHPDLPNVDDLGIPKTVLAPEGPAPRPADRGGAVFVQHLYAPIPPPYPVVARSAPALDLATLFAAMPIPAPSGSGGSGGPLPSGDVSPSYRLYQQSRGAFMSQRASVLKQIEARRRQIEHLQSYVEGGEAWVAQKEAQLTQWLMQEKLRGLQSISGEQKKVASLKSQLQNLLLQQREDARKVNLYNTEMRRAAIQFQLQLQASQARVTEEQERRLKDELQSVSKKKANLQSLMKAVNKQLDQTIGGDFDHGTAVPTPDGKKGAAGGSESGGGSEGSAQQQSASQSA